MTNEPLSARIAALEQQAANLSELHALRVRIVHEIQRQQVSLADVEERIAEGQHAEIILKHLTDQTERVLNAGELLRSTQPDWPEPHEQASPETNSESIRVELDTDLAQSPITELPITKQTPANTTETDVSDSANSETNSSESPIASELEPAPDFPSAFERLKRWIAAQPDNTVFDVHDIVAGSHVIRGTAKRYLSTLIAQGVVETLPGTATPGNPARYRKAGTATVIAPADNNDQPEADLTPKIDENGDNAPEPSPPAEAVQDDIQTAEPADVIEIAQKPETAIPSPDAENQTTGLIVEKPQPAPIAVTDLMCEQLLGALRAYGQPLQPSALASRLKKSGFGLHEVTATANELIEAGKLRRLPDGKYLLNRAAA